MIYSAIVGQCFVVAVSTTLICFQNEATKSVRCAIVINVLSELRSSVPIVGVFGGQLLICVLLAKSHCEC